MPHATDDTNNGNADRSRLQSPPNPTTGPHLQAQRVEGSPSPLILPGTGRNREPSPISNGRLGPSVTSSNSTTTNGVNGNGDTTNGTDNDNNRTSTANNTSRAVNGNSNLNGFNDH